MTKILLTAFTIFVLATLVKARGNLLVGNATNSHLIYHETHERIGIPLVKRDKEIEIKATGEDVITLISVQDLKGDGESYIKRGGVGLKDVTIKMKSARGHGYKFIIDVYAAAPNRPLGFVPITGNMGYIEFEQWSNQSIFTEKSRLCSRLRGLTPGQKKICRRHKDHMPAISSGVKNGISECQFQFQGRRWNCTTVRDPTVFGPLTLIASRETAFTHAITSAGASLWIARACRAGRLASCGCGRARPPAPLRKDWVWAGCGTDLHYSYRFTEGFIDIRERERKVKRGSREQGRQLMNRHNNEAGRRAVIKLSRVTCKCHGVSGSCSLITCWQQLATIREIGDYLRDKYEGATEVKVSRRGRLRLSDPRYTLPTAQDLVYLEDSPDYCVRNDSLGAPGTTGRECNRTSAGTDGCSLMCCGRGYNTKRVTSKERCRCKFIWCCRVECDTCVSVRDVYTCK